MILRSPRRGTLQVNILHRIPLCRALAHQVAKVLERHLALGPDLERVLAARAELLDRLVERHPEVVGRVSEDFADRAGDAA